MSVTAFTERQTVNIKPLVAEFVGTFTLIFIGVGAIAADNITGGKLGLTGIALAHGLAIAIMVTATAAASGGHLNPAVTISLWSLKKIDAKGALQYIVAQCLGAICAAAAIKGAMPAEALAAVQMGTPALGNGITLNMGLMTEMILTFFLVFAVLGTAVDSAAPKCGGLFIGLTVAMDIFMGGPITGAAMNPARHLGPAVMGGGMQNIVIYWVGPVLGGLIAAQVYRHFVRENV